MTHILSGIPGVFCAIDDALVSKRNQQEHDQQLKMVLQKMEAAGVTLKEKCVFYVSKIKFIGHIISKEGIQVNPEKLRAIMNLARPQNVSELRRLLGRENHVGKFAKNLAETTKPLRDLRRKDTAWIWDESQKTAFQTLKKKLSSAPVLIQNSADKETKVSAYASSYGLGGVLLHKWGSDWRPVFYTSRSLIEIEKRYAQIEKEALAVTWYCKKFADFLIGQHKFMIETDYKSLLVLLKTKQLDELTSRIQCFRMHLMRFSNEITHTTGKNLLTADALSGSSSVKEDLQQETETDMFVRSIIENISVSDKRLEEIRQKQNTDSICGQVMNYYKIDYWPKAARKDPKLMPYWFVRQNLTIYQGLLLY